MEARGWTTRLIITLITLLLICSKLDSMPIHNEGSQRSPLLRRLFWSTPFWRMITDSKPIQAYCQNDYECSTKTCRDRQCTHSKYVS